MAKNIENFREEGVQMRINTLAEKLAVATEKLAGTWRKNWQYTGGKIGSRFSSFQLKHPRFLQGYGTLLPIKLAACQYCVYCCIVYGENTK